MSGVTGLVILLTALICMAVVAPARAAEDVSMDVDWEQFLSRSDLVWTEMPAAWREAGFIGNGILGTIFWQEGNGLYFEISRTDAYDHRNGRSIHSSRYRMPNGNFLLAYTGSEPSGQMRLELWNAEARGIVPTGGGEIRFRTFTHAIEEVILLEVTTAGEERLDLAWHPDVVQTPRLSERGKPETAPYPPQTLHEVGDVRVSVQEMPESEVYNTHGRGVGQMATAWKIVPAGERTHRIYISQTHSYPGATAKDEAVANVNRAAAEDFEAFVASHRAWWHGFYPKSFLSIPDARLESFYWIQMYKMASATRADRPIIDLAGPWFKRETGWPGIWWNLNIQCAYAPFYVANHNDLANSMIDWMVKYKDNLEANAGGNGRYGIARTSPLTLERPIRTVGDEVGNFGYALHNIWQQYRMTMDDEMLREKLYPFMRGNFLFYMDHYVYQAEDGTYHLHPSNSPEYTREGYPPPPDANYSLSVLRWMMGAMVYADERLGLNDPIIKQVKEVQAKLTAYPTHPGEGFTVGRDQRFAYSHRHWSHLFMIYPFYEYTYDDPEQGKLIDESLAHWLSYSQAYRGYSWLAAASMTAMKGDGDTAVEYLYRSLDHDRFPALPNTLYLEGSPVIETPLLAARTIQDLVLTSYNGIIRVFPAIPDHWRDVAFHHLRAEGAFLISAKRKDGETRFVRIESLAGEPCRVRHGLAGEVLVHGSREFEMMELGNGVVELDLKQGEWAVIYSGEATELPENGIEPVEVFGNTNYWGTITEQAKQIDE